MTNKELQELLKQYPDNHTVKILVEIEQDENININIVEHIACLDGWLDKTIMICNKEQ